MKSETYKCLEVSEDMKLTEIIDNFGLPLWVLGASTPAAYQTIECIKQEDYVNAAVFGVLTVMAVGVGGRMTYISWKRPYLDDSSTKSEDNEREEPQEKPRSRTIVL